MAWTPRGLGAARRRAVAPMGALLAVVLVAGCTGPTGGSEASPEPGREGAEAAEEYGERLTAWADDLVAAAGRRSPTSPAGIVRWRSLAPVLAEQPELAPLPEERDEPGEAYVEATRVAAAVESHVAELAAYEEVGLGLRGAGVGAPRVLAGLTTDRSARHFDLYDANSAIVLSGAPDDVKDRRKAQAYRQAFADDRRLLTRAVARVRRVPGTGELAESGRAAWAAEVEWCRTLDEEMTAYLDGVAPQDAETLALQQLLFECDLAFEGTVAAPYYQRGLVSRLLAAQVRGLAAGEGPVVGDAYREALGRVRTTPAIQQDHRLWLLWRITELEQTGRDQHGRARATLVHDDPQATDPRSDVFLLLEVMKALDLQLDEKETAGLRDWVLERLAGPGPVEMEETEPALVAELADVGSFADWRRARPRVVRLLTPVTRALDDRRGHARAVAEAVRSTRP